MAIYFFSSSIITFIKEIEPTSYHPILNVDHTNATPAIIILISRECIVNVFSTYAANAASTMGKMQYPNTQTHWKKEICPPRSLVLMVTTNDPPHMIKNSTPKDLPLSYESIPRLRMLHNERSTKRAPSTG